jgi:hypothetical protein
MISANRAFSVILGSARDRALAKALRFRELFAPPDQPIQATCQESPFRHDAETNARDACATQSTTGATN